MKNSLLTPFRLEVGLWLLIIVGLAFQIGNESDWGRQWEVRHDLPEAETIEFRAPELVVPFQLQAPDTFLETSLRPIFVPTRRPAPIPPPPPPPAPPKPQMRKGQFFLAGTTIVAEGKFAHLVEKATRKSYVIAEGKDVNGIKVQQVTSDFVILTQHDDSETVVLSRNPP